MTAEKHLKSYRKLVKITLTAVYILFVVGATVRASGAGMGCPDWPTCFGKWIPPTSEVQLPTNYQEIYTGYTSTKFNVVKTWTEYFNRLTGVTIGFLIFLTALSSIKLRQSHPRAFYSSVITFFMVAFQGWLGSRVVASNLVPGMVTLHMLIALMIVATLLFSLFDVRIQANTEPLPSKVRKSIKWFLIIACTCSIVQLALGTQVRELIDFVSHSQIDRNLWSDLLPNFFYVHRSFSAFIILFNLAFGWYLYKHLRITHLLTRLQISILSVILLSIATGAILNHINFPAIVQPFHLLMASFLFSFQFFLVLHFIHLRNSSSQPQLNY